MRPKALARFGPAALGPLTHINWECIAVHWSKHGHHLEERLQPPCGRHLPPLSRAWRRRENNGVCLCTTGETEWQALENTLQSCTS
jgi:hypothetical protein